MSQPVLVFDGHCPFCQRQAKRLVRWSGNRIQLESFHEPGVLERYRLSRAAAEEAMQLVLPEGRMYAGAAAAAQALQLNPLFGWLGWVYKLPGIKQLSN